jgi:Xaa-Pro aminopeptidase
VPDVLIYADTVRSPELRHEIPLSVPDPFLYLERNGTRHVVTHSLELPRLRAVPDLEVHPREDYGLDELMRSGSDQYEIRDEIIARACRELGVSQAIVPGSSHSTSQMRCGRTASRSASTASSSTVGGA